MSKYEFSYSKDYLTEQYENQKKQTDYWSRKYEKEKKENIYWICATGALAVVNILQVIV